VYARALTQAASASASVRVINQLARSQEININTPDRTGNNLMSVCGGRQYSAAINADDNQQYRTARPFGCSSIMPL